MSATLAMLIKELDPNLTLNVVEMLSTGAKESSNPWNNAGTGHAGLCELNYTPIKQDGSIDISKSKNINFQFEESKQFWAYLAKKGVITTPTDFISPVPHISFVQGKDNVAYLKKRFIALKKHYAFEDIEFTEDYDTMCDWMPLMMKGRTKNESIAATRVKKGTDVNFGSLTHGLLNNLETYDNASIHYNSKVIGLQRKDNTWQVTTKNLQDGSKKIIDARFVFLGAGGGALQLLQMSDIKEGKGFGGFPVSGQWLRCDNQEIVKQHYAKVYSQSEVGSPPMSVPHLDTRIVEGKQSLLFGPYAGFSSKFLCHGSYLDLPLSIRPSNIGSMLAVARDNFDLTRYLVKEVLQSEGKRFDALRQFYPQLDTKD
ncbi:UNVERIFIED_CONTAM: hypothetical protein GTU68_036601, partial [Idotea baltica]|nr:hypothetical protein [Idotea baltica]